MKSSREEMKSSREEMKSSREEKIFSREEMKSSREEMKSSREEKTFSREKTKSSCKNMYFLCTEMAFSDKSAAALNANGRQLMAAGRVLGVSIYLVLFEFETVEVVVLSPRIMYLSSRIMCLSVVVVATTSQIQVPNAIFLKKLHRVLALAEPFFGNINFALCVLFCTFAP
jgi:hypothetical protein